MTRLARRVAAHSWGHLWCRSLCESGSVALQRRGPASQKSLRFGVGSGIHTGVQVSGPTCTGSGPRGHAGLCHRPGGQTISATVHKGPPRPPGQAFPGGSEADCPLSPPRPVTQQARLRRLGLWGSHPGLPVHSAPLHRPSSSSTSSVPRHARGSDLALGLGMKPKKHLDDRCAYRQALPRPTGLDNVPPGLFPHLLQACYCWTSRTDRHPFTPGPQAGHRRTVATPPSCPGVLPETCLRGPW